MSNVLTQKPFGLWDSPIGADAIASDLKLGSLAWTEDNCLLWVEGRSGRNVVVLQPSDGHAFQDVGRDTSVRGFLNYGGGEYGVGHGCIYLVAADSGRILRQPLNAGTATPITPAFGGAAAPVESPDGSWLLYLHTYEGQDSIAIVDTTGKYWPQKLVAGSDFYMQPCWHPGGKHFAWISWNHPFMAWDSSTLHTGKLSATDDQAGLPIMEDVQCIAGGKEISVFQPEFSPNGEYLAYVSDESGWWHIYLYNIQDKSICQVTSGEAEHGHPAWVQGMRTFSFLPDGEGLVYIRNQSGFATLWHYDQRSNEHTQLDLGADYSWLEQVSVSPDGCKVALLASGPTTPGRIIVYDLLSHQISIQRRSSAEVIPANYYSHAEAVKWRGFDEEEVHGLYYAPKNPNYSSDGKPPLLVLIHGGPTSQRMAAFYADVSYFTSRGYAVLQVNYRGSSGYGRVYRDKLRGNWGISDVEDSVSGAQYLVDQGLVDRQRLAIMGGSAGGFTVLKAMEEHPDFFKAGVTSYGVSDIYTMATDTHKFEAHYMDLLVGKLPEAAEIYRERSPIFHLDKIKRPVAVFQGADDQVVVPSQSEEVVASLRRRGIPHIYHLYEGEGHGFHKPETLEHFYTAVEQFLIQYVIYD